MKLRKFYPSQVLRRLNGKRVDAIDSASRQALNIGLHRSRRSTLAVTICGGQIDVRNAAELGRMMLQDFRRDFETASKLDYSRFLGGQNIADATIKQ